MTWSNLRFNVCRSFVTMARNLPSCFSIQFLEQLLKFLANFALLKYVKSQRSYGFLITKELIFGFQILYFKDHFSAFLSSTPVWQRYQDKIPRTKPPGQNLPDKIPLDKIPPRTKSPRTKSPWTKSPQYILYFIDSNIFY